MIVIFISADDNYFNDTIDFFIAKSIPFQIVSLNDCIISEVNLVDEDFILENSNGKEIRNSQVAFYLYRSGKLNNISDLKSLLKPKMSTIEKAYLMMEADTLIDFIYDSINQKSFGHLSQKPLNKLKQLSFAKKCGLSIPKSYIYNSKFKVKTLNNDHLITKAIQENVGYQNYKNIYYQRVEKVMVNELPEFFFPSLFQENLLKDLEIRSFYFNDKFYSIAFTSKHNHETIDMRDHYDSFQYFKYILPEIVENNLSKLFKKLNLFSGSVDLILGQDGEYFFLEINPEGQYDWVSKFGGYNLNKIISEYIETIYHDK